MKIVTVIPSIGAASLPACLDHTRRIEPAVNETIVVLSGRASANPLPGFVSAVRIGQRLGFAAAVNAGLEHAAHDCDFFAVVNDDAILPPHWLRPLIEALDAEPRLAAVQGTVVDAGSGLIDGRGITLDRFLLPVQVDRGAVVQPEETAATEPRLAVSATAALFRSEALREVALPHGAVLDPAFGSYHEDLDLGLRLRRLGWTAAWVGSAPCTHLGSASGGAMRWRHPWWLLANRWRALSGNLTLAALVRLSPLLLRGEARAIRTLSRDNPRAPAVAAAVLGAIPALALTGLCRVTPGRRLRSLGEVSP